MRVEEEEEEVWICLWALATSVAPNWGEWQEQRCRTLTRAFPPPFLRHRDASGNGFPSIFFGPESDYWLPLPVTHWLTHSVPFSRLDMTLACEDANSKLVDVVTVADEDRVGNSLLQIRKLRFDHKAKLIFRLWAQGLVKILQLKFRQDLKLEFGQYLLLMFCRCYEVESWLRFWS